MKCPICEATLRPGMARCPDCGYRPRQTDTAPTQQPTAQRPAPRNTYTPPNATNKRTGCCCCLTVLIPVLMILVAVIFSLVGSILEDFEIAVPEPAYPERPSAQAPFEDLDPDALPAPADESCFVIAENTLMFVPENWDGSPVLNVPGTIDGEEVRNIGPGCFAGCSELTTIILPDTVTAISPMAFSGCKNLRGLYLHEGLQTIGRDAFDGCVLLEAISIPRTVTSIAPNCFDDCANLLYIFYDGDFETWNALYSDYINPYTTAICVDGYYYHGAEDEILTP